MVLVGLPPESLRVPIFDLVLNGIGIIGSIVGTRKDLQETLDLALELIEAHHGAALARRVGEWFIRTEPRRGEGAQRPGVRERYGVRHAGLLRVLEAMEGRLEAPLPREALAATAGVSVRQLERLFRAHLGGSIAELYLRIRLDHARHRHDEERRGG